MTSNNTKVDRRIDRHADTDSEFNACQEHIYFSGSPKFPYGCCKPFNKMIDPHFSTVSTETKQIHVWFSREKFLEHQKQSNPYHSQKGVTNM